MKYIILSIIIILFICLTILFFRLIKNLDKEEILYPNYEHYKLDDKEGLYYDFLDGNHLNAYKIIQTGENEGGEIDSLFYKIDPRVDDYILIAELPPEKADTLLTSTYTIFYKDKLYFVRGYNSIYEYKLNKEKVDKKQIQFDTSNIDTGLVITSFYKIENDFLYLPACVHIFGSNDKWYEMKCSLNNYVCEEIE